MSDVPGQLDVAWAAAGVEIALFPLRKHPSKREPFWVSAMGWSGLLAFAATPPLILLRSLAWVSDGVPPVVLAVMATAGVVGEAARRWRHENAHLRITIEPSQLVLEHHMGPLPVVTEAIALDRIQRVEVDEAGTLRVALRDGPALCEPLPALTEEARRWIVETLQMARKSNANFWRDQVASADAQAAMKRLAERAVTPPR